MATRLVAAVCGTASGLVWAGLCVVVRNGHSRVVKRHMAVSFTLISAIFASFNQRQKATDW